MTREGISPGQVKDDRDDGRRAYNTDRDGRQINCREGGQRWKLERKSLYRKNHEIGRG